AQGPKATDPAKAKSAAPADAITPEINRSIHRTRRCIPSPRFELKVMDSEKLNRRYSSTRAI
ncbi:MAG: hypothetical protein AAFX50_06630, partial [Acidobacteriota bacterium]